MEALEYKMVMALNGADLGSPLCEYAAAICAEIAEQHCAEQHPEKPTVDLTDPTKV
jgi:hypothetical protein